ncbi:MAG: DUF5049 domain-containing protein [Bacteroidales bacterium]|nr:DUF5049 domain-containing protein [Bacteroidales bacterium]
MMTTTKELKACPFCGGEMEITTGGMGFFFECSECKASWHGGVLTNYATQNKRNLRRLINSAIEKWNSNIRKEELKMAIITEEIKEQILKVRATGLVNMLDINGVQRVAFDNDFYELVCLIEEDKRG